MSGLVPIWGMGSAQISGGVGKYKLTSYQPINLNWQVENNLSIEVMGHANIYGSYIEAGELDAKFGHLFIATILSKSESKGWNLSSTIKLGDMGSISINGKVISNSKEMLTEATSLIGRDKARIIVEDLFTINGAMIANAERDFTGKLTDKGKLELSVGKLTAALLIQHDQDYELGAGLSSNRGINLVENIFTGGKDITFGLHKGKGYVYPVIGNGKIVIKDNVNKINKLPTIIKSNPQEASEFKHKIKLDPLYIYISKDGIRDPYSMMNELSGAMDKAVSNVREIAEYAKTEREEEDTKTQEDLTATNEQKAIAELQLASFDISAYEADAIKANIAINANDNLFIKSL